MAITAGRLQLLPITEAAKAAATTVKALQAECKRGALSVTRTGNIAWLLLFGDTTVTDRPTVLTPEEALLWEAFESLPKG